VTAGWLLSFSEHWKNNYIFSDFRICASYMLALFAVYLQRSQQSVQSASYNFHRGVLNKRENM